MTELNTKNEQKSQSFSNYIFSTAARWFWAILLVTLVTSLIVLLGFDDNSPLIYVRYTMGLIFVLFLPGFSMLKILFPAKQLDFFETLAFSIGISLALVPLIVLPLNFTAIGIGVSSVTLSILIITVFFSILAGIRGFQTHNK